MFFLSWACREENIYIGKTREETATGKHGATNWMIEQEFIVAAQALKGRDRPRLASDPANLPLR